MDPLERIKRALGAEKAATFERLLNDYADRVEQIVATKAGAHPQLGLRFHAGRCTQGTLQRDETYA